MKRPFETATGKGTSMRNLVEAVVDRRRSDAGRGGTRAIHARPGRRHAGRAAASAGRNPTAAARVLSTPGSAGLSAAGGLRASTPAASLLCGCRAALCGMARALLLRAGLLGRLRAALGLWPPGPLAPLKRISRCLLACGSRRGGVRKIGGPRAFDRNQAVCLAIAYP